MSVSQPQPYKINTITGVAIVVANMIGTGAFTSLGFQLKSIQNPYSILTLWIVGGGLALSGAFSYAEVATVIRKSGGEYTFLSAIYHPLAGYLSGWISLTVGFAAPVALSAIAAAEYFPYSTLPPRWTGLLLVGAITLVHTQSLKTSSKFQNYSTTLKVLLIMGLIALGLILPAESGATFSGRHFGEYVFSPAFAIALVYVSYSYSGWNAAIYISEEFKNPAKSLPFALIGGTVLVTVLYTLLQYIFLKHSPVEELAGQLDVGAITARKVLGSDFGDLFSLAISMLLISGISAMVWVGPRVTAGMARDYPLWQLFDNPEDEIPKKALWLQFAVTATLLLTGTFEQILIYCGILLTLSSMLTVFGVFLIRKNNIPNAEAGFKSPLFPLFPVLFLLFSLGMVGFIWVEHPYETLMGISNLLIGWLTWEWNKKH